MARQRRSQLELRDSRLQLLLGRDKDPIISAVKLMCAYAFPTRGTSLVVWPIISIAHFSRRNINNGQPFKSIIWNLVRRLPPLIEYSFFFGGRTRPGSFPLYSLLFGISERAPPGLNTYFASNFVFGQWGAL